MIIVVSVSRALSFIFLYLCLRVVVETLEFRLLVHRMLEYVFEGEQHLIDMSHQVIQA